MRDFVKSLLGGGAARKDAKELGQGLWRADYGRFQRAVDRVHQVLEQSVQDAAYEVILPHANALGDLLVGVRAVAKQAHEGFPSEGDHIPSGALDVHHALARAAHEAASAAQAAAMLAWGSAGPQQLREAQGNIGRRVKLVEDHVQRASEALIQTSEPQKKTR